MQKDILERFTRHNKRAIDRARLIAINQGARRVTNLHLLYAIAFEKGSVGQSILKEMGFEKNSLISFNQDFDSAQNIPFSEKLKETLKRAAKIASSHHYPYIGTEHLVYALLKSDDKKIHAILDKTYLRKQEELDLESNRANHNKLSQEDLIKNALMSGNDLSRDLNKSEILNFADLGQMPDFLHSMNINFNSKVRTDTQTTPLDRFAVNLNNSNEQDGTSPIIGREAETDRLIDVLLRRSKNNPALIGEPGVGKTAVVMALAQRINKGEVPVQMAQKVIWELDLGLLLSGTTFRGEFEQRMKEVIEFASKNENVILFIDEIHNLMGAGSAQGSLDAANMLKPALAKGDLKLIGATTFDEYRQHIEKDPALERRFQPIIVAEPQEAETKKILKGIKKSYEKYHNVIIDDKAIDAAIELSQRYINDRFLPDKAIDLIDEAQAKAKASATSFDINKKIKRCLKQRERIQNLKDKLIQNDEFGVASGLKKDEKELNEIIDLINKEQERRAKMACLRITENDIKEIISRHTGIPVKDIEQNTTQDVLRLKKKMAARIVGQRHVIEALTKTIKRSLSGIINPARPLGSFVFLGPTGVGKTFAAKALADLMFKNPASFLRIDMSEFSERHNVSQLIGAPAGYVGYEDGGKLTDKVRRNPYSLILFDEIEKAHPEVFNILLQILEDGILTDATGRTVNFKNTVIVMTSNIGAKSFTEEAIGFGNSDAAKDSADSTEGAGAGAAKTTAQKTRAQISALGKLRDILLPELFNRIDNILVFNPLSQSDLEKIAQKETAKLSERAKKKNVTLSFDKEVYTHLAQLSFDKREGARLLRKNIEELIEAPLAEIILEREGKKEMKVTGRLKGKEIVLE